MILFKHNLLYKKQFGFQSNHSTRHAILQLSNDCTSFDKGDIKNTLGVFIDLFKEFDTVYHNILFKKLKY